jgi:hypothetical protein
LLIHEILSGGNSYDAFGYAMVALIVARFGEDRLRACCHSIKDFLTSYQEAALETQIIPTNSRWGSLAKPLEDMPAIPAPQYEHLLTILTTGTVWR